MNYPENIAWAGIGMTTLLVFYVVLNLVWINKTLEDHGKRLDQIGRRFEEITEKFERLLKRETATRNLLDTKVDQKEFNRHGDAVREVTNRHGALADAVAKLRERINELNGVCLRTEQTAEKAASSAAANLDTMIDLGNKLRNAEMTIAMGRKESSAALRWAGHHDERLKRLDHIVDRFESAFGPATDPTESPAIPALGSPPPDLWKRYRPGPIRQTADGGFVRDSIPDGVDPSERYCPPQPTVFTNNGTFPAEASA